MHGMAGLRRGMASLGLALLLTAGAVLPAHAGAYPWVPLGDDLKFIPDPRVELQLRLYMIRQARESIDVVIYEQGDDEAVGLPVLSALREAADRGVKVRIITHWFFQYLTHPFNESPSYTTNPPTAVPIEYVVFGSPIAVARSGWHPSDGIHGKIMIVDRHWALTTGRGHAEGSLGWIDSAFAMKGALVDQSQTAFEELLAAAKAGGEIHTPTFRRSERTPRQVTQWLPNEKARLDEKGKEELAGLIIWLHQPPPQTLTTEAGRRGRLLHYDFVRQMAQLAPGAADKPWIFEKRLRQLKDPVIDAAVARLSTAGAGSEVRFTSMYAILHPRLKQAVIEARERGAKVSMLTNGELVAPPITTMAYLASINDIADLTKHGMQVHKFRRTSPWWFMHLKLMIVDNTVFFGSHNLNVPSSAANDEMHYEIEDPKLAAECRAFFDYAVAKSTELVDPASAEAARPWGSVARTILDPVLGFY
ncbi:MAG: phosphatidylserine/phosphatidylglycerophosphate/cardiolipin synthase family protein [Myxococcota bacterium]